VEPPTAMEKVANRDLRDFGWGIAHGARYATPADFPRRDGTLIRGLRVRRWSFGFVHHSRTIFCLAVPNPNVTQRLHRCTSQLNEQKRYANERIAALLEDRRLREVNNQVSGCRHRNESEREGVSCVERGSTSAALALHDIP
jgi:hypothetical protein